jgi:prolyl oligopeptidase
MRTRPPVIAIASAVVIASAAAAASAADSGAAREDPFVWLEQVDGERAMAWVRAEDAKTAAVLEQDARYAGLFEEALEIAEAKDRIPEPQLIGGRVLNRWQDADHVRGIWRRTSLADYQNSAPAWTTILDLDALAVAEKANWFWSGADCEEPAERRCMIGLSDGGEDAVTLREFDLRSARFVDGGFSLPRGKQDAAWQDADTLLIAREWSPGELTRSGYPFVVKRINRGGRYRRPSRCFAARPPMSASARRPSTTAAATGYSLSGVRYRFSKPNTGWSARTGRASWRCRRRRTSLRSSRAVSSSASAKTGRPTME